MELNEWVMGIREIVEGEIGDWRVRSGEEGNGPI